MPLEYPDAIYQLERFMVGEILNWKLEYTIPYDIMIFILHKINTIQSEKLIIIIQKATKINEMLYMSIYIIFVVPK